MSSRQRELAEKLAKCLGGDERSISAEPLSLTADEWAALQRGEVVAQARRLEQHPDHPGFRADATLEDIARGHLEAAEQIEKGEAFESHSPARHDPEWRAYLARKGARRRAILDGRDPGPVPEPPPPPSPPSDDELQRIRRAAAQKHRQKAREIKATLALEGHHARHRSTSTSTPRTSGIARRTHGTRRRPGTPVSRREHASRGSPSDDPPEGEADDEHARPPELLLSDLETYVQRIDPFGVERDWLVEQVAALGHPVWRVRIAISLFISEGLLRAGVGDAGVGVVWRTS